MLKNIFLHTKVILKHKWIVFKLCCMAGIPWRGLVHDLSKFSPTEFCEGVKYYQGNRSPITACVEDKGYSEARLHHRGRNKHHAAYWYDRFATNPAPIIPFKYVCEMICDKISASITYKGKEWKQSYPMEYWSKKEVKEILNPKINNVLTETFFQVSKNGIKKTINKKNLKNIYDRYVYNDLEDEQ